MTNDSYLLLVYLIPILRSSFAFSFSVPGASRPFFQRTPNIRPTHFFPFFDFLNCNDFYDPPSPLTLSPYICSSFFSFSELAFFLPLHIVFRFRIQL